MTCDKNFTLQQLIYMALRPDDAGNFIVDTMEIDAPDPCTPFIDCSNLNFPIQGILKDLFELRDEKCSAVRINTRSAAGCGHFFTCDNSTVTAEMALRKSITTGSDGRPVLNIADAGPLTSLTCDDFLSFSKAVFWTDGDCVAIRAGSGGAAEECATFDCDLIPGGLRTALNKAIGMTEDSCPAFFFNLSGSITPTACNLAALQVGWIKCTDQYGLAVDATGLVDMNTIHFYWEQSTNHVDWYFIAEGDGVNTGNILPFTNPQFLRVTMTCGSSVLIREMDNVNQYTTQPWAFSRYVYYSVNGSTPIVLPNAVLWFSYLQSVQLLNLNSALITTQYQSDSGALYAGPNHTFNIGNVANQILYKDSGSIDLSDAIIVQPGCGFTENYDINFVAQPVINGVTYVCNFPATLEAMYGANITELYTTYQWKKNGVTIPGANGKTYNATTIGSYTVVCTHHGITVTSDAIVLVVQDVPQPVFSIDAPTGSFYYDAANDNYYFASNNPGFTITVYDTGAYSGGYPAGTTFEFVGLTPPSNTDNFTFVSSSIAASVIVTLPAYLGACSASIPFNFDFSTIQTEQIGYYDYATVPCDGGLNGTPPVDPFAGQCGWTLITNNCAIDGTSDFGQQRACYDGICGYLGETKITINVVDNGNGTWTITTDGLGDCGGDFTAGATWTGLTPGATIVGSPNGLSIIVSAKGVYGMTTSNPELVYGQFNAFVN